MEANDELYESQGVTFPEDRDFNYGQVIEEDIQMNFFQRIFSFKGRLRRTYLFLLSILYTSLLLSGIFCLCSEDEILTPVMKFLGVLLILTSLWIMIAAKARRCHDLGHSGWYQLMVLIPLLGPIINIYILLGQGMPVSNEYGPNPRDKRKKEAEFQPS